MKKALLLILITVVIAPLLSCRTPYSQEQKDITAYKRQYETEITLDDRIEQLLKDKGIDESARQTALTKLKRTMANCQVETLKIYDKRYSDTAIQTVVSGGTMAQSNAAVGVRMQRDIDGGRTTEEQIKDQVTRANQFNTACINERF